MKALFPYMKFIFAAAALYVISACSSHEGEGLLPEPAPPAVTVSHLHISDGVVTGVDEGYSDIVFPAGVKSIQAAAFSGNRDITRLTLNDGIEIIGPDAFFDSSIAEINFPSSLKEIGEYAFYNCVNLTAADMGGTGVTILPEGAFGYSGLRSVTLPQALTEIGIQAFLKTSGLEYIDIPANVNSLGNEAFRETGATAVNLPNNISFLDQRVFYMCPNLKEVRTYGGITVDVPGSSIQSYCFTGCPEIVVFEIPGNIRRISQGLLNGSYKLERIVVPANVNYIDFSAFDNSGIRNVTVEPVTPPSARLAGSKWYGFPEDVSVIQVPAGTAEQYKAAPGWSEFAGKIQ